MRVVRPKVDLARNADGSYNVGDLIERWRAQPAGPTTAFSINNIEIEDGTLALDDRQLRRSTAVTNLGIGIPFLSSLPYDAKIRVTPRLDGAIDGAQFKLAGNSSTPFADIEEATLELNLDALALPRYMAYAPLPAGMKLTAGALTTRLTFAFVTEKGTPKSLTLDGTARLDGPTIARSDNSRLAAAKSVDVAIEKLDVLGRSVALRRISLDAPEVDLHRFADGALELDRLLGTPASPGNPPAGAAKTADAASPPWKFAIADVHIANGILHIADEGVAPALRVDLSSVALDAKKIGSSGEGTTDVAFDSNTGAHFAAHSDVDLAGKSASGHFSLTTFHLDLLFPYYAETVNLDVRKGTIDLAGDFAVAAAANPLQLTLTKGAATLADLEMAVRGETDPLWRIPRVDLSGVAFDLAKRNITIDRAESQRPAFRLVRQEDGDINFGFLIGTQRDGDQLAREADSDAEWALLVRRLSSSSALQQLGRPSCNRRSSSSCRCAYLRRQRATPRATRERYSFRHAGGHRHQVQFNGEIPANPVSVDWRVDASGLDLVQLRPYFEARTMSIVASGAVGAKGHLQPTVPW